MGHVTDDEQDQVLTRLEQFRRETVAAYQADEQERQALVTRERELNQRRRSHMRALVRSGLNYTEVGNLLGLTSSYVRRIALRGGD